MRVQLLAGLSGLMVLGCGLAPVMALPTPKPTPGIPAAQTANPKQQEIDRRVETIIESPEMFILNAQGDLRQARSFYQQQQNVDGLQRVLLAEAWLAYRDGEYWQANAMLQRLTGKWPDLLQRHRQVLDVLVPIEEGNYYLAQFRWGLIGGVPLGKAQDDARLASAELWRYRGHYQRALSELRAIPATTPLKQFQINSTRAEIDLNLGQYQQAIERYEKVNQSQLVLSGAWGRRSLRQLARNQVNLAKAYRLLNEPEQAQKALQSATITLDRLSDRDAQVLLQVEMGLTQVDMQQWPQALQTLNATRDQANDLTKASTRIIVFSGLGQYYQVRGGFDAVIAQYQQALGLAERQQEAIGQAKVLMQLGEVYLKQQR